MMHDHHLDLRRGARNMASATGAAWLLGAWLLGACGAGSDAEQTPGGDAGATPPCAVTIGFQPPLPSVDVAIVATATIDASAGLRSFDWDVLYEGDASGDVPVPVSPSGSGNAQIAFTPALPGPYRVIAYGLLDGRECIPAQETINVAATPPVTYRLRLVPRADQTAPIQERLVDLPASDFALGDVTLESGISVAGAVTDSAGAPLPAYVRAVPLVAGTPAFVEAFADDQGMFTMRLQSLLYDVLVVPTGTGAPPPALFAARQPGAFTSLALPAAVALTGTVTDPESAPLGNATVSIGTGPLPAAVATTDGNGDFTMPTHLDQDLSVTVVPPAGSPLPQLELPTSAALATALQAGATTLDIAYAAVNTRTVAPAATLADGSTPAAGAQAVWIARAMPDAGTLVPAGGAPLDTAATGTLRRSVTAGDDGAWPALTLPAAVYDVIIEPPSSSGAPASLLTVDLVQGTPSTLSMVAAATIQGAVTDADGTALGQVQVTAQPTGLLAQSPGARVTTTTAADGSFTLEVTADSPYVLVVDSPNPAHGRQERTVDALAPGQSMDLGNVALPATHRVTGRVLNSSGIGAAGVSLQVLCSDCPGPAGSEPVAVAVSDASGAFVLFLPAAP